MKTKTFHEGSTIVSYGKSGSEILITHTFQNRNNESKFFRGLLSIKLVPNISKLFMVIDGNYHSPKELSYDDNKSLQENLEFHLQKVLNFLDSI